MHNSEPEAYVLDQTLFRATVVGDCLFYDKYRVVRTTPKGAWVITGSEWYFAQLRLEGLHELGKLAAQAGEDWSWKKWIGLNSRFAQRTKEDALSNLRYRNASYIGHCERRLRSARAASMVIKAEMKMDPGLESAWDGGGLRLGTGRGATHAK